MNTKRTVASALNQGIFDTARKALEDLPELPREQKPVSMREGIRAIRDSIVAAKARGYTTEAIIEHLKSAGIDISAATLDSYMRPERKRSAKKNHSRRADAHAAE